MDSSAEQNQHPLVFAAKISQQAQRYDEMAESMKKLVMMKGELTTDEGTLLSVAYKKAVDHRRSSRRTLLLKKWNEESNPTDKKAIRIGEYQQKIESELSIICQEIITLLDENLIPSTSNAESKLLYYKMKGDYYRYMAEYKTENEKKEVVDKSMEAYEKAVATGEAYFPPIHPIRLGAILNFSVLLYDTMNLPERALIMALEAYDEATADIDTLTQESNKNSISILELIRDNFSLWNSDLSKEEVKHHTNDTLIIGGENEWAKYHSSYFTTLS